MKVSKIFSFRCVRNSYLIILKGDFTLWNFINQCYEQDGTIGTYKITAHFHDDEESDTIARILALDNRPDDLDKAYGDYMKIISLPSFLLA